MLFALAASATFVAGAQMRVGTGIFDATGEVAQVNFMGYAMMNQVGAGLHQRLRARAYYVDDGEKNIVFVSVDFGMGSHAVKVRALELLQQDNVTKGTFTLDNLCVSGTHTHSGPAGFMNHLLFQVTSLGFQSTTYEAYAERRLQRGETSLFECPRKQRYHQNQPRVAREREHQPQPNCLLEESSR